MTITTFNVPGISGGETAAAIAQVVKPTLGVSDVLVNVPARLVQVHYDDDRVTPETLKGVIESAGYRVQRYSHGKR